MVLLTHQDTLHTRFSSSSSSNNNNSSSISGSNGVALEQQDVLDIAVALQKATTSFDGGHQSTASVLHSSPRRTSSAAVADTVASADGVPFIVSGPLLPIRQARRGANANRNYRVFGTPPLAATDIQQQQQQQPEPIDMFAPPTPVSASASSASYSSRAAAASAASAAESGSRLGSRGSGASNKSSLSLSGSAGNSASDTLSTLEDALAGRPRQIRVYDKHQMRGLSELTMEPVMLCARRSTHVRSHSSNARTPHAHGSESDGRSGSVRVSSLLPSARSSPMISSRRGLSKSVSPRGSLAPAAGAGLAAQHYYVQRVPNGPLSEKERLSNELAARTSSQICIASPKARLHEQKQQQLRALSSDTGASSGSAHAGVGVTGNGEPSAYFADSETDGNHYASAISETMDRLDMSGTESRAAARSSWNVPSDDNGPTPTDRQRRRQAVRTSVVTEKYHVLPIPISPGVRPPESLARAAMPKSLADSSLPASIFQKNFSYNAVDAVYGASSSEDDTPALPTSVRQPLHGQSTDQVHHMRRPVAGSTTPSLDHRATSFDLGQIGCRYEAPSRLAGLGGSLIPDARQASRTLENSSVRGVAARRTGTRSSTRLALTSEVRSGQAEKSETGYDGDSEGALRVGARVAVQRRNTVAGDKVGEMPALNQRPARMKMSRNTSDYSDLGPSKDERRAMRGSRRRPSTNPLLPIGTQIAPGHANYVLMYNMLTGIRVSVSRCEAKDSRPVRFDDYLAAHKYSFDVVGDEMTPSSRYDFKFKDYAPWVFRCIREAFHLSTEDYLVSLTDKYILSEVGSSGKSGSFFYYSQDYRFIIKTVHHTEHKFMRQILPQYYEFVRDHPNTLLSRIYGLHRIKLPHGRKVHFIVMSNILPPNKDIHAQFDLKGSMLGRELSAELAAKPRACMKDKNWVKMRQRLHLGPAKRRAFVKQLIEDVTLLIRLNIMDYSLLVGVHDLNKGNVAKLRDTTLAMFDPQTTDIQQLNRLTRAHTIRKKVVHTDPVTLDALPLGTVPPLPESMFPELRHSIFYREDGGILSADPNDDPAQFIYYLGVIDILTPYNMVKRTEHFVKAIVHDGSQISAINPRKYGLRFLRFMIHSLEGSEDVLPLLDEFERTTFHEICREHRLF